MKKSSMLMLFMLMCKALLSCDVCGCASSSQTPGILPAINKHVVGIGYQWNQFDSKPHHGETPSQEYFQTMQIWGRWNAARSLQLYAFLPYKRNTRQNGSSLESVSGIGDASLQLRYFLLHRQQKSRPWQHALQAGLGIKFPTGTYNQVSEGIMLHPNIQAGTGSYDKQMNLQYTLRYRTIGMNSDVQYSINGTNPQHVHFGNKFLSAVRLFAWVEKHSWIILPQAGMQFESAKKDLQGSSIQEMTGGSSLLTSVGTDIYYKHLGLLAHLYFPTTQNLGEGYIRSSPRLNLNFIFSF